MATSSTGDSAREERVNQIIAAYLKSVEEGPSPDRQELLARHPDLTEELSAFFADHDRFQRAAAPLQAAAELAEADDSTLDHGGSRSAGPGTMVRYFGDYELLEEIARGGMGVVYRARQTSLNREVALKMILAGQLASVEDVKRFHTEAEAAANLQHPNIVAIHEVGEHEGQHYFSMDYVDGKDLAELVRDNPLPAARAAAYLKTIAEAIHFAHQRGTLHRDLKPQNVLIDRDDRPRITDFGLAKRVESDSHLTQTGAVLGSPSYMPPEQAWGRHDQVGPHSDVYSLGAILYCLLSGRPPFHAATAIDTLRQVIEEPPAALRKLNPDVPQDLETICLKCLEKRPELRYHSARELAEELGRFLNHEPIHARPVSAARRAAFWARRHPWSIAATASLLVIGLAFLAYGLWVENRFLVWQQANPGYVRAPGPLTEKIDRAAFHGAFLWFALVFAQLYYFKGPKGFLSWNELLDPDRFWVRDEHPPVGGLWKAFGALGGAAVVYGFYLIGKITEGYVWEGTFHFENLLWLYMLFLFGIDAVWRVIRDVPKKAYGSTARSPSAEEIAPIRQAVLAGDVIEAIKLYRRKVAGASKAEAREFVGRLAAELEAKHPGQIAANLRRLYRVSPTRLAIGLAIESAVLGAILLMQVAEARVPCTLEFVGNWLFGLLLGWLFGFVLPLTPLRSRLKRLWPFLVMLATFALVGMQGFFYQILWAHHPEYNMTYVGPVVGVFAGVVLPYWTIKKTQTRKATPASAAS